MRVDLSGVGNRRSLNKQGLRCKTIAAELKVAPILLFLLSGFDMIARLCRISLSEFMGLPSWSNYTIECDAKATEKRRQMGDAGVVAQRYSLTLFGNSQKLELESWQPETARTVRTPFTWKADTWYRLKLQVENMPDGKVRARGKAWPASDPEPSSWTLEKVDSMGNHQGSPGIYADAPFEVFFDNLKVTPNS